eukprot:SAG31_NODE_393_length_16293_cov_15.804372_3_plen_85_part_00
MQLVSSTRDDGLQVYGRAIATVRRCRQLSMGFFRESCVFALIGSSFSFAIFTCHIDTRGKNIQSFDPVDWSMDHSGPQRVELAK